MQSLDVCFLGACPWFSVKLGRRVGRFSLDLKFVEYFVSDCVMEQVGTVLAWSGHCLQN